MEALKFSTIVNSLVPDYVIQENPLVLEFLKSYFNSQEYPGASFDILQNIEKYVQVDKIANLVDSTTLLFDVDYSDSEIFVESIYGFPRKNGLIKIGSEVIGYEKYVDEDNVEFQSVIDIGSNELQITSDQNFENFIGWVVIIRNLNGNEISRNKIVSLSDDNSVIIDSILFESEKSFGYSQDGLYQCELVRSKFVGCKRGFVGITNYNDTNSREKLVFEQSELDAHNFGVTVENLSILFLKEFFKKLKNQIAPGFEDGDFYKDLNEATFVKNIKQFYASKGSDCSFELLFRALFGKDVEVLRPSDNVIEPSSARFENSFDLIVKAIEGNIYDLKNRTIYQDEQFNINKSKGIVQNVELISKKEGIFYRVQLDNSSIESSSIYGNFKIHPNTKLTSNISANSSYIDVDSTIGFPNEGEIVLEKQGISSVITYKNKTSTQFLECSGIDTSYDRKTDLFLNSFAYAKTKDGLIKFYVTGVLDTIKNDYFKNDKNLSKGDLFKFKSIGVELNDVRSNTWIYNIPIKSKIKNLTLEESSNFSYRIEFDEEVPLYINDKLTISPGSWEGFIISKINQKTFIVRGSNSSLQDGTFYTANKSVNKADYFNLSEYSSNVQNTYFSREDNSIFVNSQSIPNYRKEQDSSFFRINKRLISFSGTYNDSDVIEIGTHPFYTGDSVVYKSLNDQNTADLKTKVYYVERISNTEIKLYNSRSNIYNQNSIKITGNIISGSLELSKFNTKSLETLEIRPQNLLKEIVKTTKSDLPLSKKKTNPGTIGMFSNGVELLNYKSKDFISYGSIEKIIVRNGGSGFDVINPPTIEITDVNGTGAEATVSVSGSLNRIDVIDKGFDYVSEPVVEIIGGNGAGAKAKVNLEKYQYDAKFNSSQVALTPTNTISFSGFHKLRSGEKVTYLPDFPGVESIAGLTTSSSYFVSVVNDTTIKLHSSFDDSINQTNPITFTSSSSGKLRTAEFKNRISEIIVTNPGSGYKNNLRSCNSAGISTFNDTILVKDHGYNSGEVIRYDATNTPIVGLTSATNYYVIKIDSDRFRLSQVSTVSGISSDFYYRRGEYLNLTDSGSGEHKFNYPEIQVSIKGKTSLSTSTYVGAVVNPIFHGEIDSINLTSNGNNYGSEIINYDAQPHIKVIQGSNAKIKPVIVDGSIKSVIIENTGSNYYSTPEIVISGSGSGAILIPVIENRILSSVKVVRGGIGYSDETVLTVKSSGINENLYAELKKWRINLVERYINSTTIDIDDGFVYEGNNTFDNLRYTHLYASRSLRKSILGSKVSNGKIIYTQDLNTINGVEVDASSHSPIIGWAYDGNPIYGPNGYSSNFGGKIKQLKSGYSLKNIVENRPELGKYPIGFFVEDYEFTSAGDLDIHNGRYCITPEFPNGTYAYFSSFSDVSISGDFRGYKKPAFPYVVGDTFKSNPIQFNFDEIDDNLVYEQKRLLRNVEPYKLKSNISRYDYFNSDKNENIIVDGVTSGNINQIKITNPGRNYSVGDKIIFESSEGSVSPESIVSKIKLSGINSTSYTSELISDVTLLPVSSNRFIGYTTLPHTLKTGEIITIASKNNYYESNRIKVLSNKLKLNADVGTPSSTGLTTYFKVSGDLNSIISNDLYQIDNEVIKILNIDKDNSRLRVLRNQSGSIGTSYSSGIEIVEKSRTFEINLNVPETFNYKLEKEVYVDPLESVGVGTSFGVGITSTLLFSNPGFGATQLSIPTKAIYIKNHIFVDGDSVVYNTNNGSSIAISTDGITSTNLSDEGEIYAYKIDDNLIGLSTVFGDLENNLLYFTGIGTGNYHSFTPQYDNKFDSEILKNEVVVSTASSHYLLSGDSFDLEVISNGTKNYKVEYDQSNRRLVVNKVGFNTSDINIVNNTIFLEDHEFVDGDKVIYKSTSPSGGLVDGNLYYIRTSSQNKLQLCNTKYEALNNESSVNITSASSGYLLPINPHLRIKKYERVVFDLSDSSLSYIVDGNSNSAFNFKLFKDSAFTNEFLLNENTSDLEVIISGSVGVTSDAKLTLVTSKNVPENLYYNLIPIKSVDNPTINLEIVNDFEQNQNNKITISDSLYNKVYNVTSASPNEFRSTISNLPENVSYAENNSTINCRVSSGISTQVVGSIEEVKITSFGQNLKKIPKVSSINSKTGYGAILVASSDNIGKITKASLSDIGYNYNSDLTLRPSLQRPIIIELEYFNSIDKINVTSVGKNYNIAPKLILIDGYTENVVEEAIFDYNITNQSVKIIKNVGGISQYEPQIIPINNTNGVGINSISYNSTSKIVTVTLNKCFNSIEDYPFEVNDKVLIEGVSIGIGSTLRGYNSSIYNYARFKIVSFDANIGGCGSTVSYSMDGYVSDDELLGTFDSFNSSARIVPEKHFPKFEVITKKNQFFEGEEIVSGSSIGKITNVDLDTNTIKVSSQDAFYKDTEIAGRSSHKKAKILNVDLGEISIDVNSSSKVSNKWKNEKGFLNRSDQRIHDSDFYQYFSYEIKSEVDYEKWNPYVSNLNHTAGFKKFSNMINVSKSDYVGIQTSQDNSDFMGISFVNSVVDLDCYSDFDLSREYIHYIDGNIISKQIEFNSKLLQDYIESVGNFVFTIDNLSDQFNSNPRADRYTIVDTTDKKYKKYLTYIYDVGNPYDRQLELITVLTNGSNVYINEYAKVYTQNDIGSFDGIVSGDNIELQFYPNKFAVNNYDLFYISIDYDSVNTGVGTDVDLGDSVKLFTAQTQGVGLGTTSIIGISSDFRTSKLLVSFETDDSSYRQIDELFLSHDGSNVYLLEYGNLVANNLSSYTGNIGEYDVTISGSELIVDLNVLSGISTSSNYTINTHSISIGNTSLTGVGSTAINAGKLSSNYTPISSSPTPSAVGVASLTNGYEGAYFVASVEDLTNNTHRSSEIMVFVDYNNSNTYITEYAINGNDVGIGTFGTDVVGTDCRLLFTPQANIDVEVRVFQLDVTVYDTFSDDSIIDQNNFKISSYFGSYTGTDNDIKKSFDLTHKNYPIFQKEFDGSNVGIVSTVDNTIFVPGHFFITGEKVSYTHAIGQSPISIASTNIPGIGITNILPSDVFIIKVNDLKVKLAASASNALSGVPIELDITSVGVGTNHYLTAQNQNTKALISIDNLIQSPIVGSSVTTTLSSNVDQFVGIIELSDVDSFYGGDLIKIGSEIMQILTVGVPGNPLGLNLNRGLLGTLKQNHFAGDIVSKIDGNYNIVGNTIYFTNAPYGNVPFTNPLDKPDEVDYFNLDIDSKFNGRVFLRSGVEGSSTRTYQENYTIDSLSPQFTGFTTQFTLKSNGADVTGISTGNSIILINGVFQSPEKNGATFVEGAYSLQEQVGVTSISFTGFSTNQYDDINLSGYPRGGIILSIASSEGTGYQPLISAGGTAIVSAAGTIQSISIGYSGSGYRSGIQTNIKVGVSTNGFDSDVEFVGVASALNGNIVSIQITNPGSGYTSSNPPRVIIDDPYSYSNLPLIYSSTSSGIGTGALIDLQVGQGSTTASFNIKNYGYAYNVGDVLTVAVGGTTGIPTTNTLPFQEFRIEVDSVYQDKFSGWRFGDLDVIDSIDDLIDGVRRFFPIKIDGVQTSLRSKVGSRIELKSNLLVFVNDVLQVPDEGYKFKDGSVIEFTEAPFVGSKINILFYRGTSGIDTINVDIIEPVEIGDTLIIGGDDPKHQEDERIVSEIINTDTVLTNLYDGRGIDSTESLSRPITLCKQRFAVKVDGLNTEGKSRNELEGYLNPNTNIIQPIGVGDTVIYVESVKSFFDNSSEYLQNGTDNIPQKTIYIINQDTVTSAAATAIVSAGGTISSIAISDGGIGYSTSPQIIVQSSPSIGTSSPVDATASAVLSIGGTVQSIIINNSGTGYTSTNPPLVIISTPTPTIEKISNVTYEGDFGIISGISTVSVGIATTGLQFDFFIEENSVIRDSSIVGSSATTVSGIQTGYYFTIKNSNIGNGVTSLYSNGSVLSIGSSFIDNVYEVASVSIGTTDVPGVGNTSVAKVIVSLKNYNGISGLGYSSFYGEFSWGRLTNVTRKNPSSHSVYNNGIPGINTSPIVIRKNKLRYFGYS